MEILLQTYYILLPIITTALLGWLGTLLKRQINEKEQYKKDKDEKEKAVASVRKANSEGIKLVLRYMLNRYHTEYMIQSKITYAQYKDWMELFAAYQTLGGNSIAMEWNEDIENLEKCNSMDGSSVFETLVKEKLEKNNERKK